MRYEGEEGCGRRFTHVDGGAAAAEGWRARALRVRGGGGCGGRRGTLGGDQGFYIERFLGSVQRNGPGSIGLLVQITWAVGIHISWAYARIKLNGHMQT
jgi:hypothetical protein